MSYILDALRRLEQDKERAKKGANPMEAVLVPDIEGTESPARNRFWWTGAGLVLLVTVIAATYWITRRSLDVPTQQAVEGMVPHLSSAPSGYDLSSVPASSPETASSPIQPLREAPEPPVPSPKRAGSSLPVPASVPSSPSPLRKPAEAVDSSLPVRTEGGSRPAVSTGPGVGSAPQEGNAPWRDVPEDEGIEDWTGSEFKINAIAYSRDARRRFAVINLKTVREGDQFEGLSVVAIQENGVVLEKEGRKYRILLGKR